MRFSVLAMVPGVLPFFVVTVMAIGVAHATDVVDTRATPVVEEVAQTPAMVLTGTLHTCPRSGFITELNPYDFTPTPTTFTELRLAVNAKLASAQRGKLGMKVDWCCPGKQAYEVPSSGWHTRRGKGATNYDVTITEVWCQ